MFRALVVLLLVAPVQAATLLTDAQGDLAVRVADAEQPLADERYQALDLTQLDVTESAEGFTFKLTVAGFHPPGELYIHNDGVYRIEFRHADTTYQIRMNRAIADQDYVWADLLKVEGEQATFVDVLDAKQIDAEAAFEVTVGHDQILDSQGSQPVRGRMLEDFVVTSNIRTSQGFINLGVATAGEQVDVWDRMPDSGFGADALPVQNGLPQLGHAALSSPVPIRGSNGEEGTFVFELIAENKGEEADTFTLSASGVPSDWSIAIPDAVLEIPAQSSAKIPVIIGTPFGHQHGSVKTFRVEMQSHTDSASRGQIELGIRYFAIPQPAGHHNELWFHSARFGEENQFFVITDNLFSGNGGQVTFNTLSSDPNDQHVPVKGIDFGYGFHDGVGEPYKLYRWFVFMQPDLQLGLDFDTTKTIEMDMSFQSTTPVPQATISAELVHFAYDKEAEQWRVTTIGVGSVGPVDVSSEPTMEHFTMDVNPAADLLPFAERAFLGMFVNMTTVRPGTFTGAEAPEIAPGGSLVLPLFEYRDAVDDAFLALDDIRMEAEQTFALVNPAKSAVFDVTIENLAKQSVTYDLRTIGIRNDWTRMPDGVRLHLEAGQSSSVRVAIDVPADARDGDVVDVVLAAQDVSDANRRSLLRLVAEVDTDVDHEDATILSTPHEAQTTPMPLVMVVAALGLSLRRRGF